MPEAILTLENITYSYDDQPPAIQNISIEIKERERIAVIGNNGAGKSTLFLCCNGVLQADQGNIFLKNKPINYNRKDLTLLRQSVGMVFQDPSQQFVATSVEGDVSFGPINLGLDLDVIKNRVNEAVELMSLENLRQRPPHYLSGGEKKRLSIADVIAMHPEIILFDEPTASLDSYNTGLFEQLLERLSDTGRTSVISTHDVDFAWRWASRILLFDQGKLVADDTPEKIFSDFDLLDRAKIKQPSLLCFTKILSKKGIVPNEFYPKSLEELSLLF